MAKEVAESCLSFLHIELVQALLGSEPAPTTAQLQHAGRKLEAVGFQVGQRLVERYTKDRPRFSDTLEIIKFICKDFWFEVYRKQIDKLQTNNRGVYMLQDNKHRLLARCSASTTRQGSAKQLGALHAKYPAGLIRGALSGHIAWSNASPTSRNPTSIWPSFAPRATALLVTARRLGVVASVGVEVTDLPACQFTIRIQV